MNETIENNVTASPLFYRPWPDNAFGSISLVIVLAVFCTVTVFGNCLVVTAVCLKHYLHTPTGFLIVSLAISDVIVGLVVMPFNITLAVGDIWHFGLIFCDIWHSFDVLASTASIWNLCVISLDRYLAIQDPLSYRDIVTFSKVMVAISAVWFCSACISFPAIAWWRTDDPQLYINATTCMWTDSVVYISFSSVVSFFIPLALILLSYWRVYVIAARHEDSLRSGRKILGKAQKNSAGEDTSVYLRIHRGGTRSSASPQSSLPSVSRKQSAAAVRHHHPLHSRRNSSVPDLPQYRAKAASLVKALSPQPSPITKRPRFDRAKSEDTPYRCKSTVEPPTFTIITGQASQKRRAPMIYRGQSVQSTDSYKLTVPSIHEIKVVDATPETYNGQIRSITPELTNRPKKSIDNTPINTPKTASTKVEFHFSSEDDPKSQSSVCFNESDQSTFSETTNNNHLELPPAYPRRDSEESNNHKTLELPQSPRKSHRLSKELTVNEERSSLLSAVTEDQEVTRDRLQELYAEVASDGADTLDNGGSQKNKKNSKPKLLVKFMKEKRAAKTLGIVVGCFLLCWLPFFIVNVLIVLCPWCMTDEQKDLVFKIVTWLGHCNSALNPLIYTCFNREFKRAFKQILCTRHKRYSTRRGLARAIENSLGVMVVQFGRQTDVSAGNNSELDCDADEML